MLLTLCLALLGLVFIFTEFFFTGIILALLGAFALVMSIISLFWVFALNLPFFLGLGLILAALFLTLKLGVKTVIKKASLPEKITVFPEEENVIGKEGIVFTDLRPRGKILIEEESYLAWGEKYISKGKKVIVVAREGNEVKVREVL